MGDGGQFRDGSLLFDPMYQRSAAVYELLYTGAGIKDYPAEAAEIRGIVEDAVPDARSLLDVACGTGAHLRELRHLYSVEGVDKSPAMLDIARSALPDVPLHLADMRTLDLGRTFDAVICMFSSIGYIDEPELTSTIGRLARHVSRPGVLILDGWVRPDAWRTGTQGPPEIASDAKTTVVRLARTNRVGNVTEIDLHYLVRTSGGVEYFMEHHRLVLVKTDVYVAAMRDSGLTTRVISDFMPGRDRVVGVAGA
jgi:dTDP-3-amino-3,6-dideoxy-alpha-D-glucopyranose N,N-dimethyltransferase